MKFFRNILIPFFIIVLEISDFFIITYNWVSDELQASEFLNFPFSKLKLKFSIRDSATLKFQFHFHYQIPIWYRATPKFANFGVARKSNLNFHFENENFHYQIEIWKSNFRATGPLWNVNKMWLQIPKRMKINSTFAKNFFALHFTNFAF